MLKHCSDEGDLTWDCPGCKKERALHVSHEGVWHSAPETVMLPPCDDCGSHLALNVAEHTKEQMAPPILTYDERGRIIRVQVVGAPNFTDMREQHTEMIPGPNGRPIATTIYDRVIHPVPWIGHHAKLREHMVKQGKPYKEPPPPPLPSPLVVPKNFRDLDHAQQLEWAMRAIFRLADQQGVKILDSFSAEELEGKAVDAAPVGKSAETVFTMHASQLLPAGFGEVVVGKPAGTTITMHEEEEGDADTAPLEEEGTH